MSEAVTGAEKKVCVTGASGFIASWLVKLLLQRGYTVNATVRDPNDPRKTEHLLALDGAKERLHLFKADLVDKGSFDSAIAGCEGVFHTASPVIFRNILDPQAEVVDPAVSGTLDVLSSCKKFHSVRRVVLTSSNATILFTGRPLTPEVVVDETWFSDPDLCKGPEEMWYVLSKTLAEAAAWKFAKENGIDLVSINPGLVLGPLLQPILNETSSFISNLIGAETYPNMATAVVHVEDVAEAHIRAFEIPSANGRYYLAESVAHYSEIVEILHDLFPSLQLPTLPNKTGMSGLLSEKYQLSKAKVESLGIRYIPLRVCLKDTVESLKEKGFLPA